MPRRNRCTGELEHPNGCTASAYVVSSVLALVLVLGVPLAHVMFFVDASPVQRLRRGIAARVGGRRTRGATLQMEEEALKRHR